MVLLTSSQVSVAISSAIIVSFTTALFLSGYVIQQRTLRQLRAAIRTDTSPPQVFLPDRFKNDVTKLEDDTIVVLDDYNRPVRIKAERYSLGEAFEPEETGNRVSVEVGEDEEDVRIEVTELTPETSQPLLNLGAAQDLKVTVAAKDSSIGKDGDIAGTPTEKHTQRAVEPVLQGQLTDANPIVAPEKPQLAPWQIRKEDLPREELLEPIEGEGVQKPVSRAQRRRLIKEEIQRLSKANEPIYYQRRLW